MAGSILLRWLLMPSQRLNTVVCSVESGKAGSILAPKMPYNTYSEAAILGVAKKPTV